MDSIYSIIITYDAIGRGGLDFELRTHREVLAEQVVGSLADIAKLWWNCHFSKVVERSFLADAIGGVGRYVALLSAKVGFHIWLNSQ